MSLPDATPVQTRPAGGRYGWAAAGAARTSMASRTAGPMRMTSFIDRTWPPAEVGRLRFDANGGVRTTTGGTSMRGRKIFGAATLVLALAVPANAMAHVE